MLTNNRVRIGWDINTFFRATYKKNWLRLQFSAAQNADSEMVFKMLYPSREDIDKMIGVLQQVREQIPASKTPQNVK
jgi:hypothetical protein